MAKTKKTKTKAKKAKKKTPARKAVGRKAVAKKTARKKKVTTKRGKPASKAAPRTKTTPAAAAPKPVAAVPPPAGEPVGIVTHYYNHLSVAIIKLETASLREGELVRIKGHTSDFTQRVESMEVDHEQVSEAHPGQSLGLRVKEHAREHDVVYKVAQ